jgi:hypothetical protein
VPSMHRKHSSHGRRSRIHGRNSGGVHRQVQKTFQSESSPSVSENKGEKTDFMRDELGAPKMADRSTFQAKGRPTSQWSRLQSGYSDDLGIDRR